MSKSLVERLRLNFNAKFPTWTIQGEAADALAEAEELLRRASKTGETWYDTKADLWREKAHTWLDKNGGTP